MKPLDRNLQRRVWARVYDRTAVPMTAQQRQALVRCLQRSRENLTFYQKMQSHSLYAEAFTHLANQTAEQIKMLKQILG